jgi:anti-sigma regulatory factor (Ser/Thr protein kinase)
MTQPSHQQFGIRDRSDVGAARRALDALAAKLGLAERVSESARIAATELGSNILRHGKDGYLLVRSLDRWPGLELLAVDRGRGIADPAGALAGVGATTGGLGVGLGAVQRLATSFDLYTGLAKGTVVLGRFCGLHAAGDAAACGPLRSGGVSLPVVPGDLNGDGWAVTHDDGSCAAVVVDGLGHGPAAHRAAQAGLATFDTLNGSDVGGWLHGAHTAMRPTRGGVAAVARIDLATRRLWFAGVGNVQGKLIARGQTIGLVSQPGILGTEQQTPRLRVLELPWVRGASLLLWSDGLRSTIAVNPDRQLFTHDPTIVAAVLHRDHARGPDDATVVVVQDRTSDQA